MPAWLRWFLPLRRIQTLTHRVCLCGDAEHGAAGGAQALEVRRPDVARQGKPAIVAGQVVGRHAGVEVEAPDAQRIPLRLTERQTEPFEGLPQ